MFPLMNAVHIQNDSVKLRQIGQLIYIVFSYIIIQVQCPYPGASENIEIDFFFHFPHLFQEPGGPRACKSALAGLHNHSNPFHSFVTFPIPRVCAGHHTSFVRQILPASVRKYRPEPLLPDRCTRVPHHLFSTDCLRHTRFFSRPQS